jgi:hypothetical protein
VDGYCTCVTCGVRKPWKEMQAGHFIDGRNNAILFDELGVYPQCYACNCMKSGNKVEYFRFMQEQVGDKIIDELRKKAKQQRKFTEEELIDMRSEYNRKAKEYETA